MDIRSAIAQLLVLEKSLTITQPIAASIKNAYSYAPNRNSALPDQPCWLNAWDLGRVEPFIGPGTARDEYYTVNAQLFVLDADPERAADIATSFLGALIAAWDYTLAGTVSQARLRGGNPTLATLEWAGKAFQGLNLFVDVELYN